jgi:2-hydroxycyclohexanecarboxyl-CoA dehydrogenase
VRCDQCRPVRVRLVRRHHRGILQRLVDVNLTGTFHCCQIALPDMVAAGWGRIVMISVERSAALPSLRTCGVQGCAADPDEIAAREYAHGITVNNIPPSGIETPMQHARRPPLPAFQ